MLKVKIMNDMQTNSIPRLFIVCNSMPDPILFFAGAEKQARKPRSNAILKLRVTDRRVVKCRATNVAKNIHSYHMHLFGHSPLEESTLYERAKNHHALGGRFKARNDGVFF